MKRKNISELKKAVREKYAWPGGYPLSVVFRKCGTYCMECVKKEWRLISDQTIHPARDCGWGVAWVGIQWEGRNYCEKCNVCVDAYPSDEEIESTN